MKLRKYYPTIVLSDIHLGSEHSRTEEVTNFLKHVNCGRPGDWVESLTALVENEQGEWNIVSYDKEGYTADEMLPSCLHYAEVI